ncbi:hypothetical protein BDW22DRAFT_1353334 [Trametopsis cervina]|nr:hypothetical protein BDW22DRAFT_1353334 [Trametopsis cervina]
MGGNAFATVLPTASFPRMSPEVYNRLKMHITARLRELYETVAVPHEAPEKTDYGDIDFVVCSPRKALALEAIREAIGVEHAVQLDGNRMSHFAVPAYALGEDTADPNVYHQVDIRVCADADEFQRIVFFSSYGDLGMIIGLLAKASDLSYGSSGLRLSNPVPTLPPCTFYLSKSLTQVLAFFGLSIERWDEGFSTRRDVFDWVASSPFFDIWNMTQTVYRPSSKSSERPMHREFLQYAYHRRRETQGSLDAQPHVRSDGITSALTYFGKSELYEAILYVSRVKLHVKTIFTGHLVESWAGLRGQHVAIIMWETRLQLGGNDVLAVVRGVSKDAARANNIDPLHLTLTVWEEKMGGMTADEVRDVVVQATTALRKEGVMDMGREELKKRLAAYKAQLL